MSMRTLKSNSCLTVSEMLETATTQCANRGHTRQLAWTMVSEFFDIPLGRVKDYVLYGRECPPHEKDRIRRRYLDHLDTEQRHLEEKLLAVRAQISEANRP